jgi:hypothetical protein
MSAQMDKIITELERMKLTFNLAHEDLGQHLAEANAAGIKAFMDQEIDPGGSAWPSLSFGYAYFKEMFYPGQLMAHLEGVMKTDENLIGSLWVSPTEMRQQFGTEEQAQQEAAWFSEGNENQPPRPFYELNDLGCAKIAEVLDARFDEFVPAT